MGLSQTCALRYWERRGLSSNLGLGRPCTAIKVVRILLTKWRKHGLSLGACWLSSWLANGKRAILRLDITLIIGPLRDASLVTASWTGSPDDVMIPRPDKIGDNKSRRIVSSRHMRCTSTHDSAGADWPTAFSRQKKARVAQELGCTRSTTSV